MRFDIYVYIYVYIYMVRGTPKTSFFCFYMKILAISVAVLQSCSLAVWASGQSAMAVWQFSSPAVWQYGIPNTVLGKGYSDFLIYLFLYFYFF